MSNHDDNGVDTRMGKLEAITSQQAELMRKMADQLTALFVVNTALLGVLRGRMDIESVRTQALEAFTDQARDRDAVAIVNAMLGPVSTVLEPAPEEVLPDRLRRVARSRFIIIDGGRPEEAIGKPSGPV